MTFDYLIVGAGYSGAVFARMAAEANRTVMLIDRRDHIAGNAYDFINQHGLIVQKYGPHIFHTKIKRAWEFLSRFTEWNDYVHRVLINLGDKKVYLPINLDTMEKLYDRSFTAEEMEAFLAEKRIKCDEILNSRDVVLSQVGEELYDLFFKNYTKKQWGVYPDQLNPLVLRRIPLRFNRDTRYFEDPYQGIPRDGFTAMFSKIIDHPNITCRLNTEFRSIEDKLSYQKLIYTGPVDAFFDYKFGKLPYRSLDFEFKTLDEERFQEEAVVNYPNHHDYTRITEFKQFYFQENSKTTICYEFPKGEGDPFYPVPRKENQELYQKYKQLADNLDNVYFLGRLAEYKYINMDLAVDKALSLVEKLEDF